MMATEGVKIGGVITAMATPFGTDLEVDLPAARSLARRLASTGSDGIVVAGTTGESPTLSDDEKLALLSAVLEEVGEELTVICGTGSNDTRHSERLSAAAAAAGAHAVLVVTPYYNKPSREGLLAHFEAVARAAGVPVILYNIPGRTAVNMPPDLLEEIGATENVVAVKQANDDEIGPLDGLDLLAGNDGSFLRCLREGATGGILVASHLVGERLKEMFDLARAGDMEGAERIDAELTTLYEALSVTTNPIPLKHALDHLGIVGGEMRLPLVRATAAEREAIESALAGLGLGPAS